MSIIILVEYAQHWNLFFIFLIHMSFCRHFHTKPQTPYLCNWNHRIPLWLRSNANLWSPGQLSDSVFIQGIQYVISNGMIQQWFWSQWRNQDRIFTNIVHLHCLTIALFHWSRLSNVTELEQDEQNNFDKNALTRRDFLKLLAAGSVALTFTPFIPWGNSCQIPIILSLRSNK